MPIESCNQPSPTNPFTTTCIDSLAHSKTNGLEHRQLSSQLLCCRMRKSQILQAQRRLGSRLVAIVKVIGRIDLI